MHSLEKENRLLDGLGLTTIGLCCLGYVVFIKIFAEQHLQLPFLNFPVFVGEWLLLFCFIVFLVKCTINKQRLHRWQHYLLIAYFYFVILKAFWGYPQWGPLAFRHAALFYYPAFAIFGYAFYRRDFFSVKMCTVLLLLIFSIFITKKFLDYWILTLTALGVILIRSYPSSFKLIKFLMLLVLFSTVPYKYFFATARMMIVANFVTAVYLATMFYAILKVKKGVKLALSLVIMVVVILGLLEFANLGAVKSIVSFKRMAEVFREDDLIVKAQRDRYLWEESAEVKLFNPDGKISALTLEVVSEEKPEDKVEEEIRQVIIKQVQEKIEDLSLAEFNKESQERYIQEWIELKELVMAKVEKIGEGEVSILAGEVAWPSAETEISAVKEVKKEAPEVVVEEVKEKMQQVIIEKAKEEIQTASVDQVDKEIPPALVAKVKEEMQSDLEREIQQEASAKPGPHYISENSVFRLFIWRDMLVDLIKHKPIFGFDFGRPFRSISLEILDWGRGDWGRDGWIGAHNSYLEMIYRAGIVGILLILSFLVILFNMIKKSVLERSMTGILLCGIVINWFAAANFLLILELPYTAIPIWTIYGMTLAYCFKIQKDSQGRAEV